MASRTRKVSLLLVVAVGASLSHGFGESTHGEEFPHIPCLIQRAAEGCRDAKASLLSHCVWCKSKTLPAQCVTPDLADRMPRLLFTCDGDDDDDSSSGDADEADDKAAADMEEVAVAMTPDEEQAVPAAEPVQHRCTNDCMFAMDGQCDEQVHEETFRPFFREETWPCAEGTDCNDCFEYYLPEVRFGSWKEKYGVRYESEEEEDSRFMAYAANLERMGQHNSAVRGGFPTSVRKSASKPGYTLGLNRFSDMTWGEFQATRLGFGSTLSASQNCSATHHSQDSQYRALGLSTGRAPPPRRDWRELGAVSVVKDQDHCGSCWTFSTTGCLESHHYLRTGEMVLLSEQQLVDCAGNYDNHGCSGGLPSHAFEYIAGAGGLDTEEAYPYLAEESGSCSFAEGGVGAGVMRSVNITFQDEAELLEAVGNTGPVSVAFQVAPDFKAYAGGVYDNPSCSTLPEKVNHAVLCVGYDTTEDGVDYWIIKNSWGSDWGIDGYFHMVRGKNMCGVADCASFPLVP